MKHGMQLIKMKHNSLKDLNSKIWVLVAGSCKLNKSKSYTSISRTH